jgi:hypothetical protein
MKITICGSIAFFDEMLDVKKQLEELGHKVDLPPTEIVDEKGNKLSVKKYYKLRKKLDSSIGWIWERKKKAMLNHFKKEKWADAILVLNFKKKNIEGYIGANTLIEMGLALYLGKKIYLMYKIPKVDAKEEILGMQPIVLNGNLKNIV